jgi:hypothetical protein
MISEERVYSNRERVIIYKEYFDRIIKQIEYLEEENKKLSDEYCNYANERQISKDNDRKKLIDKIMETLELTEKANRLLIDKLLILLEPK